MALSKLGIGIIASVIGISAVGGITAAVVTSQNNNQTQTDSSLKPNEDENVNPNTNINLEEIVKNIKAADLVFEEANDKSNTYAFNVTKNQLKLSETKRKSIPKDVRIDIDLDNNVNNGAELNRGELQVSLKASFIQESNSNSVETNTVKLTGFKVVEQSLNSYLKESSQNPKASILDLTKSKQSTTITLKTLEDLNKLSTISKEKRSVDLRSIPSSTDQAKMISGLSSLFQEVNKKTEGENDQLMKIFVDGEVKLADISKDTNSNLTIFHLVNKDINKPLKLVQKQGDSQINKEAFVNEILVTNLLATNVFLEIKDFENDDKQKALINEYVTKGQSSGYEIKDQNISLKIKEMPSGTGKETEVGINLFALKRTAENKKLKLISLLNMDKKKQKKHTQQQTL